MLDYANRMAVLTSSLLLFFYCVLLGAMRCLAHQNEQCAKMRSKLQNVPEVKRSEKGVVGTASTSISSISMPLATLPSV